ALRSRHEASFVRGPATTALSTLSLHDALPIFDELEALDMRRRALTGQLDQLKGERNEAAKADARLMKEKGALPPDAHRLWRPRRSEEHTSELQSRRDLVCRLLLEKKHTGRPRS